jgi:hypothetical protein
MERKDFLQIGCRCGISAVATMLLAPVAIAEGAPSRAGGQQQPELSTQVHAWVVDLLAAADEQLAPEARARLLQACGRAEALRGKPAGPPRPPVTLEQMAAGLRRQSGEDSVRLVGNRLEYAGTRRCECPLVGAAPERLSDTWCECARGYMMTMMTERLGRPVQVDLVEAIKRGGQQCRWVFTVA